MELVITEKNATICLNMIVKNESHIIETTLEKLCKKIKFDYWVICDTGSTDNTAQIIIDFFDKKNINGEMYHDEWNNFAYNRTLALQRAYKKTGLLLIFDADDEIIGDINIPNQVLFDEYHLKFGSIAGTSYTRVLLINNNKQFEFLSVIHEFICCKEPHSRKTTIEGNYYIVSGRSGSRNLDPNKYLNDALILEKAHKEALQKKDPLFHRYSYYCANSYKDCGRFEDAIKWYKITLEQKDQWNQEKYTACLYIYECYKALNQEYTGFYYLVKSFAYDNERVECLYPLLVHYCCEDMNNVAYNYYLNVKDFFENRYLITNMNNKLFIINDKYNFFVPYYMILIADKVQDFKCVIKMYELVFIKKQSMFEEWYIKNFLYNLQFFIQYIPSDNTTFIPLANEYLYFLNKNNVNLSSFDFLNKIVYIKAGINTEKFMIKEEPRKYVHFTKEECMNSNNILIYTGFCDTLWNYTHMLNNALGGSEKAIAYLSKCFPKNYNIYISGHVINESVDNIQYIHLNELPQLIKKLPFHTVIVSRYISFYEMFQDCTFYRSFIWAHDTLLLPYGCNLIQNQILNKWNKYINACICLTNWHRDTFIIKYPEIKDKIELINNGLELQYFNHNCKQKIKNKFIYTSRPERGLKRLLELWPKIVEKFPDSVLSISSYGHFPSNNEELDLKNIIDKYDNIHHLGSLSTNKLYEEMSSSEYWLYPTNWPETSCITALEMLMSEVVCLYYPEAGLTDTMDKYGIQIQNGNEIEKLITLTEDDKQNIREAGKKYAEKCSWNNRCEKWLDLINRKTDKPTILFLIPYWYIVSNLIDYFDSLKSIYNVIYTQDFNYAVTLNPDNVIFVFEVSDENIYNYFTSKNIDVSILNTEPLNLIHRYTNLISYIEKYKDIKVYDYSLSNIKILNENGYTNTKHLEYTIYENEITFLKNLNQTINKIYNFGIICGDNNVKRRRDVINYLIKNNYSVRVINGWKEERDRQLASCQVILNIHGSNNGEISKIFEHIRCDRLLAAGYNILSETNLLLDENFINKYTDNLKLIEYNEFFDLEIYRNLEWIKSKQTNKIIDCFTFYNEINMLNYRLNVLNDVVDYFIIVEANQTHVGKPKQLFFEENKKLFEKFLNKIIHIVVDLPFNTSKINIYKGEQWTNEKFQRSSISRGLDIIKSQLKDDDCIVIADVDEIPDPNTLFQIKNNIIKNDINMLKQDLYYYNLNCKHNEKWYHSKTITYKKYKQINKSCDDIRFLSGVILENGGWHLSYFGDAIFIKNKLENFTHQEYNSPEYNDTKKIQERINSGIDLFNRERDIIKQISIQDNPYLPPMYDTYLQNFYT